MKRSRSGFSMIEILVVMMVMAIVLAFALPKFNSLRNSGRVGSAKVQLTSSITTARAAAIQHGRASAWNVSGNTVTVAVQNAAGGWVAVGVPVDYQTVHAVALSANPSTVVFDSRGMAVGLTATGKVYVRGTSTDSICITRLGVVLRNGCL